MTRFSLRKTIVPTPRAVVFDLDDCLYLESEYVLSGYRAVAAWLSLRHQVPEANAYGCLAAMHEAGVRGETFDRLLEGLGLANRVSVQELVSVYRRHRPTIRPCDDAVRVVPAIRPHYRLGLVSDGYLSVQRNKLKALGICEWFDAVVFSDELGRDDWKPSPRPFAEALRRLEVAAADAVYVADNPSKDFLGARRSGMRSIRVRRPQGLHARVEPPSAEHAPDAEIVDFDELADALQELDSVTRRC
jgi:putative hydrolase of the HAD superfamily